MPSSDSKRITAGSPCARLVIATVWLTACVHQRTLSSDTRDSWLYIGRQTALKTPPDVHGEYAAEIIGLPLFTNNSLPDGYREYRFEVYCGMCLPIYLVRLRVPPGGHIMGDAYLIWFGYDSALAADTSQRARRVNNPPNNCKSPLRTSALRGPGGDYRWCTAQLSRDLSWPRLMKALDSLGIPSLPTSNGYAPDPPFVAMDTLRRADSTFIMPRRDCLDIASPSLEISALVGREYRSAYFWCLESKAPGKPEHFRVAKAHAILTNVVAAYRDSIRASRR